MTLRYLTMAVALAALAACSKPATQTSAVTPTTAPPLQPLGPTSPAAAQPVQAQAATSVPAAAAGGYSCSFPGPDGRSILARFTLDGATAHDDQGLAFNVLTNSPTALVLAHSRDDLGVAADGDVGAYVVAIDRRTLGMVESTIGLNGRDATRRGRCIAG